MNPTQAHPGYYWHTNDPADLAFNEYGPDQPQTIRCYNMQDHLNKVNSATFRLQRSSTSVQAFSEKRAPAASARRRAGQDPAIVTKSTATLPGCIAPEEWSSSVTAEACMAMPSTT